MIIDNDGIIIGRNAVAEALKADVVIDKVFIAKGETDAALKHIISIARSVGVPVVETDRRKLDTLCTQQPGDGRAVHQGIVAISACTSFSTIEEILGCASEREQKPLIVICDGITDPHNLGAVIRTAEAVGVHGIIIPKRRSAGINPTVAKASSGAVFYEKIARVPNIAAAIRELKKNGVWVYGASPDGDTELWDAEFTDAAAFVIGAEGKGISRLIAENCDQMIKIPMTGRISSLNASVSAAILLYEVYRQRR